MKQLTIRLIIPITVLSFVFVTKWWYVVPIDARETFFWGFPFAYVGEGWQTSGSLQFFILEWLTNLCVFFIFWFTILYFLNRVFDIKTFPKWMVRTLWTFSFLVILVYGVIVIFSYPTFRLKRDYDWEVIQTGYKFIWQQTPTIELNSNKNTNDENI
ncbi:MAG: hypothetical protein PHT69_15420 [Bacteroidales bacterium]|nr:hypothetical protein [Bacteroidales bacterium]